MVPRTFSSAIRSFLLMLSYYSKELAQDLSRRATDHWSDEIMIACDFNLGKDFCLLLSRTFRKKMSKIPNKWMNVKFEAKLAISC